MIIKALRNGKAVDVMEEFMNELRINTAAEFLHLFSIHRKFNPRKVLGFTVGYGIPQKNFYEFLMNPQEYAGADAEDIITIAKILCDVSDVYSKEVCPFIRGA